VVGGRGRRNVEKRRGFINTVLKKMGESTGEISKETELQDGGKGGGREGMRETD
jgi:hypothetical protein